MTKKGGDNKKNRKLNLFDTVIKIEIIIKLRGKNCSIRTKKCELYLLTQLNKFSGKQKYNIFF